eukprot:s6407_g6.t1
MSCRVPVAGALDEADRSKVLCFHRFSGHEAGIEEIAVLCESFKDERDVLGIYSAALTNTCAFAGRDRTESPISVCFRIVLASCASLEKSSTFGDASTLGTQSARWGRSFID